MALCKHVARHLRLGADLRGDHEAAREPLGPGCRREQADHRGRHEPATSLHRPPFGTVAPRRLVAC